MSARYFFGIDGGGTYSRLALTDETGKVLTRAEAGSTNIYAVSADEVFKTLSLLLDSALRSAGLRKDDLASGCIGSAGLGREAERKIFRGFFDTLLWKDFPVKLCNDGEILLCGGLNKLEGYCLIAGTGSIALGRSLAGRTVRAGGHGYMLGDEGSAAWTGRSAIARILRSVEGRDLPTGMLGSILESAGLAKKEELMAYVHRDADKAKIAALAPAVTAAAREGDPLALDILRAGAEELALLVKSVINQSPWIKEKVLVLAGGVMEHDEIITGKLKNILAREFPDLSVGLPKGSALEGACMLARCLAPTEIELPLGEGKIKINVPNILHYSAPKHIHAVPDARAEVRRAIQNPIGTCRLKELAKGKRNAAIVVNDITRPYAGREMILELAAELNEAGMKDEMIFLVVAYGSHRVNTNEELVKMFGGEVVKRFRFVHHRADRDETLKFMGTTDGGVAVEINRDFAEADLKIITGCITPHQSAGFSGGRKSVVPGIAGLKTLQKHHSFPIRPEKAVYGWLDGNPFHEESLKAACIAGVDFIVNSVENESQELVYCVAGELNKAYMAGVEKCREIWTIEIPGKPDVVIVSPGGYPRDFDLHQSQKAVGCAELICKEGGMIIMFAEMRDGAGKPGAVLKEADTPQEIIDRFYKEGYNLNASSKAFMWARAMKRFHISILGSKVPNSELKEMFFETYDNIEEAIDKAFERYGENASFMVLPYASENIPEIAEL